MQFRRFRHWPVTCPRVILGCCGASGDIHAPAGPLSLSLAGATIGFSSSAVRADGKGQTAGRIGTDGLPSAPALQPGKRPLFILEKPIAAARCPFRAIMAQKTHLISGLADHRRRLSFDDRGSVSCPYGSHGA